MKLPNRYWLMGAALFGGISVNVAQAQTDYGEGDTIGAANNLSAEGVQAASKLVKTGKTYSLGIVTGPDTPAWGTRWYKMGIFDLGPYGNNKLTGHDDLLMTYLGIGSQIDGLGHIGVDGVFYGGHTSADIKTQAGLTKLGTENIPPIVTRGVLLDMAKHFGQSVLKEGTVFNNKEIKAAAEAQGIVIKRGDVVLFHTGWLSIMEDDPERFKTVGPGLGVEGAQYLADLGVVAVGADSPSVEVVPAENGSMAFPVHAVLIPKNGVYILENMNTGPLAADDAHEFMFVLGQPKFEGSVQAVINPIAIR
ncbi:cyclase family protein [Kordiimonas aquimaris]|uniref:cyclase family protein n=1 Tax=Kordiimonas aquimaris TaxID=707591 RepID=UPI0021D07C80|nr:cyclase family protein [Kordiimonas aquimaris]